MGLVVKCVQLGSFSAKIQQQNQRNCAVNKNQSPMMQKIKQLTLFFYFTCVMSLCSTSTINPANYIWINYEAKTPVIPFGSSQYSISIPCQARLGKCNYQFTVIPPGWSISKNGTLNIPAKDALGNGNYAVKGQFSEITGQKINANLVFQIQNGIVSVQDESEYYKRIGYVAPDFANTIKATTYEESWLIKNQPEGFIPISELQSKIINANISSITETIDEVLSNYAPCRSRANYLKEVRIMIQKLIDNNNKQINDREKSISQIQTKIKDLQVKKKSMLQAQGVSQQIQMYQKNIDNLQLQLNALKINYLSYDTELQNILKKISKYQIDVNQLSSSTLSKYEAEIRKTSIQLQDLYNKRIDLQQKIMLAKQQKETKGVATELIPNFESSYTSAAKLTVNSKISMINRDLKIDDLENEKDLQQKYIEIIDSFISKADNLVKGSVEDRKKKLQQQNFELTKNIKFIQVLVMYTKCANSLI